MNNNPAFVLGLFETGLGVIRSLGRSGIKVYGFDYKNDIAFYSKYVFPKICPDPRKDENLFINFLIQEAKLHNYKPVLYITGDEFLPAIIKNKEFISNYILINVIDKILFERIHNKYLQFILAKQYDVPVPETIIINHADFDNPNIEKLNYPVFLKGIDSNSWRKIFGGSKKGFLIQSQNKLLEVIEQIKKYEIGIIIQEYIEGPDTNHFKFNCYFDKNGVLQEYFCLQKLRQNPIHFGVGCAVQSVYNEDLVKIGMHLFNSIKYKGIGSAEFKYDERDKKFKLIEINPRYWQQNILATACGVNFPLIQYLDLTDQPLKETFNYKTGIKWVNIYSDFDSYLLYRKEGTLNFWKWLKSLKGKKIFSDWAIDDILPGFYEIKFGKRLFRLPNYIKRKLFKK